METKNNQYEIVLHDNPKMGIIEAMNVIGIVCDYTLCQCEQITTIINHNKKCPVKTTHDMTDALLIQSAFEVFGLKADINMLSRN